MMRDDYRSVTIGSMDHSAEVGLSLQLLVGEPISGSPSRTALALDQHEQCASRIDEKRRRRFPFGEMRHYCYCEDGEQNPRAVLHRSSKQKKNRSDDFN